MLFAERQGFEPREVLPSTVFKTAAIDHSATSPKPLDLVVLFVESGAKVRLFFNSANILPFFSQINCIFALNQKPYNYDISSEF